MAKMRENWRGKVLGGGVCKLLIYKVSYQKWRVRGWSEGKLGRVCKGE
jgi:hypothetical protein